MHLRCFGVNIYPCYQIRFFFECSRGAPVLAKAIDLQIHGILSINSLCLRFNMTFTTRNMSFGTKSFSYFYIKEWDMPLHTVAITTAIFRLFRGYRLIFRTNMFYSDSTITTHHHWTRRQRYMYWIENLYFVYMHRITVKMGVGVFNRQFFINLDGPSIGVSRDISIHTLLTKN